jgi:hypothetical protein
MWKNILALGALVLSVGASTHLIGTANATFGPMVSTGSNPIRSYGGLVPSDAIITTAPADQDLIVTAIITDNPCVVLVAGTDVVPDGYRFNPTWFHSELGYPNPPSLFTTGTATLRVPAGQTLGLNCSGTRYYLQGYLAQP